MAVAQRAEAWGASTHRPYAPPFVSRRISFQMVSLSLSLLHHHVIPMARRETHRDGEIILHSTHACRQTRGILGMPADPQEMVLKIWTCYCHPRSRTPRQTKPGHDSAGAPQLQSQYSF